ncbi:MAG: PilZ domain-containing protein [Candidatus Omnitrophica bacterium]|nr:PilZ domain-containing protein [Candidatus Omnitrophota bacterium]MBU4473453.1 PilZ domain-containing protein [Candidatus Omnitrophota bacterium]MCG2706212.1 PilZ domain-containing protein [Candidatus Omnitrophota bacterium]
MKKRSAAERRQHPRVETSLGFNVVANGYDFITNTQNISCVGAYCHVDKYIPPFTRVAVKLALPVANNGRGGENCDIECKGVIVRTEDGKEGGFNIAIFFNQIQNDQRKKITEYINQFFPNNPSAIKRL